MPDTRTRRLFIGTFLTEAQQASLNCNLTGRLNRDLKVRAVRTDKLHLTWLFLGDMSSEQEYEVTEGLKNCLADQRTFALTYTRFQLFPSSRNPRLIALTPEEESIAAAKLHHRIHETLSSFCRKNERSTFRPHITVMRFANNTRGKFQLPESFSPEGLLPMIHLIDNVSLIHSDMTAGKDNYNVIARFLLHPDQEA